MAMQLPPMGEDSDAEFSDDENVPLNQDIYGGSRRSVQETKNWDVFRTLPPSTGSLSEDSQKFLEVTVKILKVVTYLLTFGVVLASGVITKGIVLLMTSQLKRTKKVPVCSKRYAGLLNEKDYEAEIPPEENVVWAWMIFFCFICS